MPDPVDLLALISRVHSFSFNKIYMEITLKVLSIREVQLAPAFLKVVFEKACIVNLIP
jgi:hypothetical protein